MHKKKNNFILYLILIEVIFLLFSFSLYKYIEKKQKESVLEELNLEEMIKIKNLHNFILSAFELTWANINTLKSSEELNNFILNKKDIKSKEKLELSINTLMQFNKYYKNFAIIDKSGEEIVRLNYNNGFPISLLAENIKNNGKRKYSKLIKTIKANDIYMNDVVSENGSDEMQSEFLSSVNINNKNEALVKLTIFNSKILSDLLSQLELEKNIEILIINSKGSKVFERIGISEFKNFQNFMPNAEKAEDIKNGEFRDGIGMIFIDTIKINERNLQEKTGIKIETLQSGEFYWKIIVIVPHKVLLNKLKLEMRLLNTLYYPALIIGGIVIFLLYFLSHKRRLAEEELKISANVLENAKEGIVVTDSMQNINYVNSSYLRLMGYSKEELLGKKISEIRSNKHTAEFYEKMWDIINRYGKWQGEIWCKKKTEEHFSSWLTISKIETKKNSIRYIAIYDDLTLLKRNEENIRKLMDYDSATHLPNKNLFMDRLQQLMSHAKILNENFTVFSLSISNLRKINANYGIETADRLLNEFSRDLSENMGKGDTIAKPEGNNFYILLPEIQTPIEALELAEKILKIGQKRYKIHKTELVIYVNIGIIIYPDNGDTIHDLMKNLELALNHAKKSGGNSYEFYSSDLQNLALERSQMDLSLRKAIENKEFYLVYQPQIEVETGKLIGAESLIRWQHPILGLITPVKFIQIAEENKFINTIGEWVLREACEQCKKWTAGGHDDFIMAVNISPVQFAQEDFVYILKRVLNETGINPSNLEVELTEGMMVNNMDIALKKLKQLKNMGLKISIDDFGTGYSSLSYIKKFPIDKIKIDRIFVKDYPNNDDGKIAKTIVQLAHNLNYRVIAEGVETIEQLEYLKSIRCNEIQGYYYSKPIMPADFEEKYLKKL